MRITILLLLFWSVVLAVHCCTENIIYGYRLYGFTTEKISNIGVHACIKECLLRKHCRSINYNKRKYLCQINSKSADVKMEGTQDPDFVFVNAENSSKETLGNCRNSQCPPFHKCVNTHVSTACLSEVCEEGSYQKDGECVSCPVGQYNAGNGMTWCAFCKPGSYQDQPGSRSCKNCPAGTYQPNKGETSCEPCPAGQYNYRTSRLSCNNCSAGTYQDLPGSNHCKSCPRGTYQSNEGEVTCEPCPVGQYNSLTGRQLCNECSPGTYQDQPGSSNCKSCPTGTYQPYLGKGTDDSCIPCGRGTYQPYTGRSSCIGCSAGYYRNSTGQTSCLPCPGDMYQDDVAQDTCKDCSRFNRCYNKRKTMCYRLTRHAKSYGSLGIFRGSRSRTECKQLCWSDTSCRGFTFIPFTSTTPCYTRNNSDVYSHENYTSYTFPSECHE